MALIEKIQAADAEVQIRCAHQYPRSLHSVKQEINTLVTENRDVAESCFFTLPRGGKPIIGPSVRFAEIVASCFGNITYGSMPLEDGNGYVVSRGYCWDQQKNVRVFFDVRRKAVDRNGRPYNADMKLMTSNAASAIAMRNAILKVVPPALWMPQFQLARKCAIGDVKTMVETRTNAIKAITQLGVPVERIFSTVDAKGEADLDEDKVLMLRTLYRSVKDGEMNVDAAFPTPEAERPATRDALLQRAAETAPDPKPRRTRTKTDVPAHAPSLEPQEPTPSREPGEDDDKPFDAEVEGHCVTCQFDERQTAQAFRMVNQPQDAPEDVFREVIRPHFAALSLIHAWLQRQGGEAKERFLKDMGINTLAELSPRQAGTWAAKATQS